MKYLLMLLISFASIAIEYHPSALPATTYFSSVNYNGTITDLASNSWRFESHTNSNCYGSPTMCRKVGIQFAAGSWSRDGFTRIKFDFTVEQYSTTNSPEWLIIFQDWVRIDPNDANGNHPITTLKLRNISGKIFLQQYENSWQFNRSNFDANDPLDANHDHGLEVKKGEIELVIGQTYAIELIVADGHFPQFGHVTLSVDGKIRSDSIYQNASLTEAHVNYFGQYWSKEATDPIYQVITKIENLTYEISY